MSEEELIRAMIDFCEENWSAFIYRVEERGFTEEQVEQIIEETRP
jgi:hypothetical protein